MPKKKSVKRINEDLSFLLINGSIFSQNQIIKGYILIQDGIIKEIKQGSPNITILNNIHESNIYDCKEQLILPGFIDLHVHLRDLKQSYKETLETGTKAAISGGFTTIFAMPNTDPPLSTPQNIENYRQNRSNIYSNVAIYAGVNVNFDLAAMEQFIRKGIYGVKIYPGSQSEQLPLEWDLSWIKEDIENKPSLQEEIDILKDLQSRVFLKTKTYENWGKLFCVLGKFQIPLLFHPEMPLNSEMIALVENKTKTKSSLNNQKNLDLLKHDIIHPIKSNEYTLVKYICSILRFWCPDPKSAPRIHICHISSHEVIDFIEKFRSTFGYQIIIEVTPHHILLNNEMIFENQAFGKVLTPLRNPITQKRLFEYVQQGSIDTLGSDHAPHSIEEKNQKFEIAPSGFPSIDVVIPLLLTQVFNYKLALDTLVQYYSTTPAQLMHLKRKGKLDTGNDADLVIIERVEPYKINPVGSFSKAKWSPYTGIEVNAKIKRVFLQGKIAFDSELGILNPYGKFLLNELDY